MAYIFHVLSPLLTDSKDFYKEYIFTEYITSYPVIPVRSNKDIKHAELIHPQTNCPLGSIAIVLEKDLSVTYGDRKPINKKGILNSIKTSSYNMYNFLTHLFKTNKDQINRNLIQVNSSDYKSIKNKQEL